MAKKNAYLPPEKFEGKQYVIWKDDQAVVLTHDILHVYHTT